MFQILSFVFFVTLSNGTNVNGTTDEGTAIILVDIPVGNNNITISYLEMILTIFRKKQQLFL